MPPPPLDISLNKAAHSKVRPSTLLAVEHCDVNCLFCFSSLVFKPIERRHIFSTLCLCSVLLASPRTSSITVFDFLIYSFILHSTQFVIFNPSTPHARHDDFKGLQVMLPAPPSPLLRPPTPPHPFHQTVSFFFFFWICNLGDRQRGGFCCVWSTQSHCNH